MSMVTQCPHCSTLFRVTPQQLQVRHGRVRCGRCLNVFDGFQSLGTEPERVRVEHLDEQAAQRAPDIPDAEAPPPRDEISRPVAFGEDTIETNEAAAARGSTDSGADRALPGAIPHAEADYETRTAFTRRLPAVLAVGCVLLLLGLGVQAVYAYRVELAARVAGLKPLMVQWCAAAGCDIPLPQQPRLISIEASDLQLIDPQRPGLIKLTATLRSHAPYDVAYPALDLVLTNAQEHTLARRIFLPREYLDANRDPGAGFPPSAEVTVQLVLDAAELAAAGFRLDLLAAPS